MEKHQPATPLRHVDLGPDEIVRGSWVAGIPYGERSNATKVGGTLFLTNRRLIFEPLHLPSVVGNWGTQRWIDGQFFDLDLDDVSQIEIDRDRRSAIRLYCSHGVVALHISASRGSLVWSKKNVAARDAAAEQIRDAIAR